MVTRVCVCGISQFKSWRYRVFKGFLLLPNFFESLLCTLRHLVDLKGMCCKYNVCMHGACMHAHVNRMFLCLSGLRHVKVTSHPDTTSIHSKIYVHRTRKGQKHEKIIPNTSAGQEPLTIISFHSAME